ncbi:MAG: glycoside hydrolase family 97 protein [Prevotella sp.]|nr:glycoside hydrolase family 97 protein [Prevotella sp.]
MKKLLTICLMLIIAMGMYAKDYRVQSPNGKLSITVSADKQLTWQVAYQGKAILAPSVMSVDLGTAILGKNVKVRKASIRRIDETFATPVYKKAQVRDCCNELTLDCKDGYQVVFRAYDEGAAYRFVINRYVDKLHHEQVEFCFADDHKALIPYVYTTDRYVTSFESLYDEQRLSEMYADSLATLPMAVCLPDGMKAVIMEAGVRDYPGMFIKKGEGNSIVGEHAPYVLEEKRVGRDLIPTKRASYIANGSNGKLPWRVVLVTENDAQLLDNDMAQCLSEPCKIEDTSWIRPGLVAWDWWNHTNITGVGFRSGMNTPTYKYFIDFAETYGIPYIIIDEGWSDADDLFTINKEIDLEALIDYGKQHHVDIILWCTWRNLMKDVEKTMQHYAAKGIKGFKVDFFDRDDQRVAQDVERIAACAADHHLVLDLHGYKPIGLQRMYPNILNIEGVRGLENTKWEKRVGNAPEHDFPRNDVIIPYLRMLSGPMDYTPGAMLNATKDHFFGSNRQPMSQGTRAHQLAMYVVYEAPLQMLADSPSKYLKNLECTNFISRIPTVFDETVPLCGEMGQYAGVARRKGDVWYVGILNNWEPRDIELPLSFINGQKRAEIFRDGINADQEATDYHRLFRNVTREISIKIHLAPGGGWAAIIR